MEIAETIIYVVLIICAAPIAFIIVAVVLMGLTAVGSMILMAMIDYRDKKEVKKMLKNSTDITQK